MKQHKKLLINLVFAAVILAAAAVLLLVRKANQTGAPLCAELIYGDSNTRLTFPSKRRRLRCGHRLSHRPHQDPGRRGPLCRFTLP